MTRGEHVEDLISDLHPDAYAEVGSYIDDLRKQINSHVNYMLFVHGDKPLDEHPHAKRIKASLALLGRFE